MSGKDIRILLVEDEEAHAELIQRAFGGHFKQAGLTVAHDLHQARACLAESVPDLVITDLHLPDGKGTELLSGDAVKLPYPVVVLTGRGDERAAVEAMKAGALDYVVKSKATLNDIAHIAEHTLRKWTHITERKQAEEAIVRSEAIYRKAIENANGVPYQLRFSDGKYVFMGSGVEKLVGVPAKDLTLKSFIEMGEETVIVDLCGYDNISAYNEAFRRGELDRFQADVRIRTPKGQTKWFSDCSLLIRDENTGEVTGCIGILQDITERKIAEEALKQAKEQAEKAHTQIEQVNRELEATYEKLMGASHRAGMAEVATDVLHNVGNVLNSINVSANLITEKVTNSEVPNLKKLADIIQEHSDELGTFLTEDSRGKHIPTYLAEVSRHLNGEQAEIIEKLQTLTKNIEHVKEIVKMQQSYAKVTSVEIPTSLDELVEDAIQINNSGLERSGIKLIHEYAELGDVSIDRQRVLQILVNLISNAKYALADSKAEEKILSVRFYKHGNDNVRIEVADNGIGIPKENLGKIFGLGFTTRNSGHGFGLHSCAMAAMEMDGSLTVHSNGFGQGTTFTLEFPFKPMEVTQCTE